MTYFKELGKKLKECHDVIDDKVEQIDKYQRYVNTELDSCFCKLDNEYTPVIGEYVPFIKASGSFEVRNGRIVIKPGQRVQINLGISYTDKSNTNFANVYYAIKDYTNDIYINPAHPYNNAMYEFSHAYSVQYTNETDKDCEIGVQVQDIYSIDVLHPNLTTLTVQEIGRTITIDPLEHVNTSQGIEDTPVGHIISHMGNSAPKHYLICDGSEYNITDYPYLAQHFEDQFGIINYFGGDGENTFCVPDLRGEFLRGTGTATRDAGSGANVGVHQDGTEDFRYFIMYDSTGKPLQISHRLDPNDKDANNAININNVDKNIDFQKGTTKSTATGIKFDNYNVDSSGWQAKYTSRPTNTSVLYCIKYEPTYYMQLNTYLQPSIYSEDEKVTGCWINGKPLYEKTIITMTPTEKDSVKDIITLDESMENVVTLDGYFVFNSGTSILNIPLTVPRAVKVSDSHFYSSVWVNLSKHVIHMCVCEQYINLPCYITIQYTKATDEENSFTPNMIKDYVPQEGGDTGKPMTEEEVQAAINQAVAEINTVDTPTVIPELYPEINDIPTVIPEVEPEEPEQTEPEIPEETEGGTEE